MMTNETILLVGRKTLLRYLRHVNTNGRPVTTLSKPLARRYSNEDAATLRQELTELGYVVQLAKTAEAAYSWAR